MTHANFNITGPALPGISTFFVRATSDIAALKRTILKNEYVLIDPRKTPEDGQLVMVGSNLEQWNHQGSVIGVATFVCSDVETGGES